jgi:predicted SnoaL-like aldol condensation-catalyzing enzyme
MNVVNHARLTSRLGLIGLLPILLSLSVRGAVPVDDNRTIVTRFADLFYRQKKVEEAFLTYVTPNYIQHNPGIADGRDAAVAALVPLFGRADHSFAIERILVDGELAAIHVRVTSPTPPGHGAAVVDMYRLADGKIVEHWDVIQLVPEKSANPHPMF